jgi:hypothetical protein
MTIRISVQAAIDAADEFEQVLAAFRARGEVRLALAGLARLMQMEMTRYDSKGHIEHGWAMENVMRAIAADIEGDRTDYVMDKLTRGVECWIGCYKPNHKIEIRSTELT